MKSLTLSQIALIPWYLFAAYWAITWLRVKRTKTREKSLDRLVTLVLVVLAFSLLFGRWLRTGPLASRFVSREVWMAYLGIGLSFAGTAISVWARYCLGVYWSARVTLKEGHELIRTGPYAFVRHPIYAGMLVATIGTALVLGEWRGLLAIVLLVAAHSRKAMREESMLTREFGEEYATYRQSTGFLLPRFWRRSGMDTTPGRT
ncbi:MAG TPA: isoprenylcysteine carboxylmethyltransferase family protein [Candidatus Binatia bacterium]|nr:isoprenylcysteine carboxylmethyltransferase family protein [Candidatus Binatia bacterium]